MTYKKVFCTIFVFILFLPTLLGMVTEVTDIKVDVQLNNVEIHEKPELSVDSFFSGAFQKDFENWITNGYKGRSIIVKTYNQLRFSLFGTSSQVVGKNGDLFQEPYIKEFLGLDSKYNFIDADNRTMLETYVDELEYISTVFEENGKLLILMISPSKCDYKYEDIPDYYNNVDEGYIRGIEYLRELLPNRNIHYIDGGVVLSGSGLEYPVFYNSGIHWSRPAEQLVSMEVLNVIQQVFGSEIKRFEIKGIEESNQPFWRDADMWNLINIWESPGEVYYQYKTETIVPQKYLNLNVLIQGGSFSEGVREDFITNDICTDINYIFYNQHLYGRHGSLQEISFDNDPDSPYSDWSNLDLDGLLTQSNVVIIELNEEHIYCFNNGFIELLYNYLMENKLSGDFITNMDLLGDYDIQSKYLSGIYRYEEDSDGKFAWTDKNAAIELHNSQIYSEGLKIVLDVPEQNIGSDSKMMIKVNNQVVQELVLDVAGRKEIIIAPELLDSFDGGDKVTIEMECSVSFNPFKLGVNNDDRDLAVVIRYAGEVK